MRPPATPIKIVLPGRRSLPNWGVTTVTLSEDGLHLTPIYDPSGLVPKTILPHHCPVPGAYARTIERLSR